MKGMILPAGSPLVQFELKKNCEGTISLPEPKIIWVNRNATPGVNFGICGGVKTFRVEIDHFGNNPPPKDCAVCPCMGRFVE